MKEARARNVAPHLILEREHDNCRRRLKVIKQQLQQSSWTRPNGGMSSANFAHLLLIAVCTFLLFTFFLYLDSKYFFRNLGSSELFQAPFSNPNSLSQDLVDPRAVEPNGNHARNKADIAESVSRRTPMPTYLLIDDYASWHRRNRYKAPTLVYRCPRRACGGLGDRIRGIAQAYLVAVVTRRVFLIDWYDPLPLQDVLSPNKFDWVFDRKVDQPSWDKDPLITPERRPFIPPSISNKKDPKTILSLPNHTLIISERGSPNLAKTMSAAEDDFKPLLNHSIPYLSLSTMNRLIVQGLFKPSPQLRKTIVQVKRANKIEKPYIGVHARVGAGLNELKSYGWRFKMYFDDLQLTAARLATVAVQEWRRLSDDDVDLCCVFFATDTPELRQVFINEMKKIDNNISVIGSPWDPGHFIDGKARELKEKEGYPGADNGGRKFTESIIDLLLLAGAKSIVCLPSGFPDAAFWMGNANVFNKLKWGNHSYNSSDVLDGTARYIKRAVPLENVDSKERRRVKRFQTIGRMPWEDQWGVAITQGPTSLDE